MRLSSLFKTSRGLCILAVVSVVPAVAQDGHAQANCSLQTLDISGAFSSGAHGVNSAGAIAGNFSNGLRSEPQGFLLFRDKVTDIVFPGALFTAANDINNRSHIVGEYEVFDSSTNSSVRHGFVLDPRTGFHSVDVPQAAATSAQALNDRDDIVGWFQASDFSQHGFILRRGHFVKFSFPNAASTEANGINNHDTIVGTYSDASNVSHGFRWKNGVFKSIDFPGASDTFLTKINDQGTIVGSYRAADATHGFVLKNGEFRTIDGPPGSAGTALNDINNREEIVGAIGGDSLFSTQAFKVRCTGRF